MDRSEKNNYKRATGSDSVGVPPKISKKGGVDEKITTQDADEGCVKQFTDLSQIKFVKILNDQIRSKSIVCQGSVSDGRGEVGDGANDIVILMEKLPFSEENLRDIFSDSSRVTRTFQNDIYGQYLIYPKSEFNGVQATIIFPATDKHIQKYQSQEFHMVEETAEMYRNITKPHIEDSKQLLNLQWVYNILEKGAETERIIFEDVDPETGFILLPDLKWSANLLENLYCSVIVNRRDIRNLRDLNQTHLPLLRNILTKSRETINSKYGILESQLKVYIHYLPSYYHFHVHINHVKNEASGTGADKAHLLANVISNIETLPNYYTKVTLSYLIKESDPIYLKFKQHRL